MFVKVAFQSDGRQAVYNCVIPHIRRGDMVLAPLEDGTKAVAKVFQIGIEPLELSQTDGPIIRTLTQRAGLEDAHGLD